MRRTAIAPVVLALSACSPPREGQHRVHVTTDAILPAREGTPVDPDAPPALFDRVLLEVIESGADAPCASCSREIPLDREMVDADEVSFGVVPRPSTAGYRARARLFFAAHRDQEELPPATTLDTVVALPPVVEGEIVDVTLTLLTDSLGAPRGTLDAPAEPALGPPEPGLVGTWSGARRVPCAAPPPDGQVCVPGGAFWKPVPLASGTQVERRLVVLSPFYLDAEEVTVARFRPAPPMGVGRWSGSETGTAATDWCNYTDAPGPREDMPANCVNWVAAQLHCQGRGGDLPTETQLAYVQTALRGARYVWGDDPPDCDSAVFARSGVGPMSFWSECRPPGTIGGPLPSHRSTQHGRDVLVLPTGTLYDLAGNVSEWSRDHYQRSYEPCWSGASVYVDPFCQEESASGNWRVLAGGSWILGFDRLLAGIRYYTYPYTNSPDVGVRCAAPAPRED